jgi:hypothetical protein
MSRDMQIVNADRTPHFLKRSADGAIVLRGLGRIGQHLEQTGELFDNREVLRDSSALLGTVK